MIYKKQTEKKDLCSDQTCRKRGGGGLQRGLEAVDGGPNLHDLILIKVEAVMTTAIKVSSGDKGHSGC